MHVDYYFELLHQFAALENDDSKLSIILIANKLENKKVSLFGDESSIANISNQGVCVLQEVLHPSEIKILVLMLIAM